jgi:Tat protein secretion system quality control protein TatD with DNase activity
MKLHGDLDEYNAPHKIPIIFEHLIALRGESPMTLAQQIWENSNQLFSI